MKNIRLASFCLLILVCIPSLWADQIVLHDGKQYSGKFVRADAKVVEFQILGRIESFKTADVAQIIFKEPELVNAPPARPAATPAAESPQVTGQLTPRITTSGTETPTQPPIRQVPPQPAPVPSATLPAGTPISVRITEAIDTDRNRVGDTFTALLEDPLVSGDTTIAPRGTEVTGRIAYSKESGRISGKSELILELSSLKLNNRSYPLKTSDYSEVGSSQGRRTATAAGGVAALGAIVGAIAGGGKGAAVGAATGAAVGTGAAVLTRGQTLKIPAETILEFRLEAPLTLTVP